MSFNGNASVVASHAALRLLSSATYQTAIVEAAASAPDGGGGLYTYVASNTSGCSFTASVSGSTLTVTAVTNGALTVGLSVNRGDTGASIATIIARGSGSGGPGTYTLSASATIGSMPFTADVNSYFIVATDGGRWFNVGLYLQTAAEIAAGVTPANYYYPPYTLLRYGADPTGATDSTMALQNAINCAQKAAYAMVRVGVPGAKLKIDSGWTIDTNLTGIDFEGAWLDGSSFTSGNWCAPTQSNSDPNARVMFNGSHPIKNATWVGPGATNTTAYALYLNDTLTPEPFIAGLSFENISFVNWGQDVYFGNGAFGECFTRCNFAVFSGGGGFSATTYSISSPNRTMNSGERNTFMQCAWYNKNLHIDQQNGSCDIFCSGCSFDGATTSIQVGGGNVYLIGCHIESGVTNIDKGYWISVSGTNSACILNACEIVVDADKTAKAPFYSDASCTNGGVFLDNCQLSTGSNTLSTFLIEGTGNARVRNLLMQNSGSQPTVAAALNVLAYGGFESANYVSDGWTLSGGAARSNSYAHTGNYSLCMPGVSGTPSIATYTGKCRPGQYVMLDIWWKFPSTAAATFTGSFNWADGGGNTLGSFSTFISSTVTVGTWTSVHFKSTTPAPPGTQEFQFQFEVSGVASGTQTACIDDLVITLPE